MTWMALIDFEVPGWGELAGGPQTMVGGAGGVELIQTGLAAHPDRPGGGRGMGLRVAMEAGSGGKYVERDLGGARSVVHSRVAIQPAGVEGGEVSFLRGLTESGDEGFDLRYSAASGTVIARIGGSDRISGAVAAGLGWQCVEVGLDTSGSAELWINGVSAGSASGSFGALGVRRLWLGAPGKDAGTTGVLDADEWGIADGYIGPVRVAATGCFGDDPARWLVVYNGGSADSVAWASAYASARGVPRANLLGLAVSAHEQVSEAEFAAIRQAVSDYLSLNGLDEQVVGILLGHGVPGVYTRGDGRVESIAAQLHRVDAELSAAEWINPLGPGAGATPVRPEAGNLEGLRLTARVDGATLAQSLAMVERSTAVMESGLAAGSAKLWLDPWRGSYDQQTPGEWAAWAKSVAGQRLRVPIELSAEEDPGTEVQFESIRDDGFFWGWAQSTPPAGFFGSPAGQRVFAYQAAATVETCPTLRSATGWTAGAIAAGYAASAGSPRGYTQSGVVDAVRFFEALRRGWTLAEAWFVACPLVRAGLMLVGDPLMRVRFPRAGWNVYGPMRGWGEARLDEPVAALREEQRGVLIGAADRPVEGEAGIYVVRRVDEEGREEAGTRCVRVVRQGGAALSAATVPAWPSGGGWRPAQRGAAWEIRAWWGARFGELGIAEVQLVEAAEGGSESVVERSAVRPGDSSVGWRREPGGAVTRYKVRAVSGSGAVEDSAWSAWVSLASAGSVALTLV